MQMSIIIHTNTGFGMKLKELYDPSVHKMVIIATAQALKTFKSEDKIYLEKIIQVNDKSFQTLLETLKSTLNELNVTDYSQVRLASCDEFALRDVALLREALGIKGNLFKHVAAFTNKVQMKERIKNEVRVPKFIAFDASLYQSKKSSYLDFIIKTLGFPLIGKPVDSAGSDNITKINSPEELTNWCNLNQNNKNYELEEFIDGELYQCDSVIVDDRVLHMQACKYSTPVANFIKGKPLGSIVLPADNKISKKLFAFNEKALNAFKPLHSGVTHMEIFIESKTNECVFLECAARAPGAFTCPTYDIYLGMHHETLQCQIELDLKYSLTPIPGKYAAWVWYPNKEGTLVAIKEPTTNCEHRFTRMHEVGTSLKNPSVQRERAASILLWDANYEKLQEEFNQLCLQDLVQVKIPSNLNIPSTLFQSSKEEQTQISILLQTSPTYQ